MGFSLFDYFSDETVVNPEPSPKWLVLSEVLKEIDMNINKNRELTKKTEKILILVKDKQTCEQLKQVCKFVVIALIFISKLYL